MSCSYDRLGHTAFITAAASVLKGKSTLNHTGQEKLLLAESVIAGHIMSAGYDIPCDIFL